MDVASYPEFAVVRRFFIYKLTLFPPSRLPLPSINIFQVGGDRLITLSNLLLLLDGRFNRPFLRSLSYSFLKRRRFAFAVMSLLSVVSCFVSFRPCLVVPVSYADLLKTVPGCRQLLALCSCGSSCFC